VFRLPGAGRVMMFFASCVSAAGQEYAAREKLRAQSSEFG
jgi:hypothetical protein